MIVRVATEDQYELDDAESAELAQLDDATVAAVDAGDAERFHETFDRMVALVRERGEPIAPDRLAPSDLILPPPDLRFDEAQREFTGEGLLPD